MAVHRWSVQKLLEFLNNSQENNCGGVSFYTKVQGGKSLDKPGNLILLYDRYHNRVSIIQHIYGLYVEWA